MRLKQEPSVHEAAPTAGVAVAMLQKIDGPLELIGPALGLDGAFGFIDEDERPGLDEGVHEPILTSDVGVAVVGEVHGIEKDEGEASPALDHAAEVGGFAHVEAGVQGKGNLDGAEAICREADGVGTLDVDEGGIGSEFGGIDAVPAHDLVGFEAVDGAQRIEPEEGGHEAFVFDVGEAAEPDDELGVLMAFGDANACLFDIAVAQVQALAHALQFLARILHAMLLTPSGGDPRDPIPTQAAAGGTGAVGGASGEQAARSVPWFP